MRIRFVYAALLVWILSPVAIPADEQEPSASRWGITTKKNLEDTRNTTPGKTGSAPYPKPQDREKHPSIEQSASSPSDNTGTEAAPVSEALSENAMEIKPQPNTSSTGSQSPEMKASTGEKRSGDAAIKHNPPRGMNWSSEGQKRVCNGYLDDLRSLFLNTRHFSIQGASCETAKSAAAFLDSMEKCQRNCPDGLLEHSGYTERIIRNIRYLEKLGNDRCSGSLTPPPQVTQTP